VFDLTKVGSQARSVGQLIYREDTNERCTHLASGNLLIGGATIAVDNAAGSAIGRVRLNGVARANEASASCRRLSVRRSTRSSATGMSRKMRCGGREAPGRHRCSRHPQIAG
jgi:hypothetical protein